MNLDNVKMLLKTSKEIQNSANVNQLNVLEEPEITSEQIIPLSIFRSISKQHLFKIVKEINSCFVNGCFTGCAVLIRRLIESCMIEAFESKGNANLIKNNDGSYKSCDDIKNALISNPFGNIGRNENKALMDNEIIHCGHKSAHSRYYIATKHDIEKIIKNVRILVEYLVYQF